MLPVAQAASLLKRQVQGHLEAAGEEGGASTWS